MLYRIGNDGMGHMLSEIMIWLGAVLMAWNIFQYSRFARDVSAKGNWKQEARILQLPILLLVLFLCGYLAVGLFGHPDLLMAGILFGGSLFVFAMLVLIRRISDRIKQHEHMEAEMEAAKKASEAKTRFLSNMSHDLRTPLNAIIGYTTLANREGLSLSEAKDYFVKIDTAGKQLLDTINNVLEMSRIESGRLELDPGRTCLEDVLTQVREVIAPQMEKKHIHFVSRWEAQKTWVMCDKGQLSRSLMNLLSNACKYTPEGGDVTFSMLQKNRQDDTVACDFLVRDTGIGMSPEFVERLFTPFERERTSTISRIQGTGLGMAITKSFVDQMGGTIEVKTQQGEGTEITMHLGFPLADSEENCGESEPEAPVDYSGVRLLLAEDNPVNQEIAAMLLSHEGFLVDCVPNGQDAVNALLRAEPGTYAAILMDIQMPVMNGYEATKAIRALDNKELAAIPIIAMTANAFKEDEQAAAEAGMQGHITKPLDHGVMMKTISQVLRNQEPHKHTDGKKEKAE